MKKVLFRKYFLYKKNVAVRFRDCYCSISDLDRQGSKDRIRTRGAAQGLPAPQSSTSTETPGDENTLQLDNPALTLPERTASISRRICYQDTELIDELCRCAEALKDVSGEVRLAIERNHMDALHALRDEFDALRDQIIAGVCRLTRHRLQHQK